MFPKGFSFKYRNREKLYAFAIHNLSTPSNNVIQTGGDLIAVGNAGCVFKPNVYNKSEGDVVSKIYYNENFSEDLLLDKKLGELDMEAKYHVKLLSFHKLDLKKLSNRDKIQFVNCRKFTTGINDTKSGKFVLANYEYGGKNIKTLLLQGMNESTHKKVLKLFRNVFDGLYYFYDNGISHNDITAENIVFDGKSVRLLDFSSKNNHSTYKTIITDINNALRVLLTLDNTKENTINTLIEQGNSYLLIDNNQLSDVNIYDYYKLIVNTLWVKL